MQRIPLTPRPGWHTKLAALGVDFGEVPASIYWREDAAYTFTEAEIETLHAAGTELTGMIDAAVAHVIERQRFDELGIGPELGRLAARSWLAREPSLYGRFDLRFDGANPPKLLEYNADTPTALFEAAVVQWHWLEECFPGADQYNSIHEALIEAWAQRRQNGGLSRVHFACMPDDDDDLLTTSYLQDTAIQAGLSTQFLEMADIGWDGRHFRDLAGSQIDALFKLYPWDWLAREKFFPHLAATHIRVLEPPWRILAASKGILPILWELFPGHPNLLPAAFRADAIEGPVILKPLHGREGANIAVLGNAKGTTEAMTEAMTTDGPYGGMATVAQAFDPLPDFDGWRPVIGLWTVGSEPHGIGIREERSLVTGRGAHFVPHRIDGHI